MLPRIVGTILGGAALLAAGASFAGINVGDVPPDYLGRDFADKPVNVSTFKGKVVVVTFWATWCPPCRAEMNVLAKVQQAAGATQLQVIAVNFKEDAQKWRGIKRQLKDVGLTITRDGDWKVAEAYEVKDIPRMFMVDRSGRVAYAHVGYGEKQLDTVIAEINELLTRKPN